MFKKSTVFILHFAPSLRFTLSLQSAVCSLPITLTANRFSITAKESQLGQFSLELLLLLFTDFYTFKYLCKMYQRGKINIS